MIFFLFVFDLCKNLSVLLAKIYLDLSLKALNSECILLRHLNSDIISLLLALPILRIGNYRQTPDEIMKWKIKVKAKVEAILKLESLVFSLDIADVDLFIPLKFQLTTHNLCMIQVRVLIPYLFNLDTKNSNSFTKYFFFTSYGSFY